MIQTIWLELYQILEYAKRMMSSDKVFNNFKIKLINFNAETVLEALLWYGIQIILFFSTLFFFQSVEFNQSDWSSSMIRNDTVLNSSESLTTTSLPMTQWEWLCLF